MEGSEPNFAFNASNITSCVSNFSERCESGGNVESLAVKVVRLLGYTMVFLFGVMGNFMVILAVRKPKMRTVTNILIANLGLADLLVALFNVPVVVTYAHLWHWPFGELLCKVFPFLQGLTLCASVLTLLAIACDRYWHIVHFRRRKLKLEEAYKMLALIWVLSVVVPAPLLMFSQTIRRGEVVTCEEIWPNMTSRKAYTMVIFLILYLFPLFAISWLYAMVAVWLKSMPAVSTLARKHEVQKKVVRMLVTVVALFALCWLPYHVIFIFMDYGTPTQWDILVSVILFSQWLVFASSACNPVVYAIMNENYRREFAKMISICKRQRKRTLQGYSGQRSKSTTLSVLFVSSV